MGTDDWMEDDVGIMDDESEEEELKEETVLVERSSVENSVGEVKEDSKPVIENTAVKENTGLFEGKNIEEPVVEVKPEDNLPETNNGANKNLKGTSPVKESKTKKEKPKRKDKNKDKEVSVDSDDESGVVTKEGSEQDHKLDLKTTEK